MSEGDVRELALTYASFGEGNAIISEAHAGILARGFLAAEKRAEEAKGENKRLVTELLRAAGFLTLYDRSLGDQVALSAHVKAVRSQAGE